METVEHFITNKSVKKIYVSHSRNPEETVFLLAITDKYVVHVELCDYSVTSAHAPEAVKGKLWDVKNMPSVLELENLFSMNGEPYFEMECYHSLDELEKYDWNYAMILKHIKLSGDTVIMPKEEEWDTKQLPMVDNTQDNKSSVDDNCPF